MSQVSDALGMEIPEVGVDTANAAMSAVGTDLEKIDAFAGDIATVESSPSVAAHSVGELILYEGHLYKVTSAIAAGSPLTLGVNVSAANIGNEIKSLQDSVAYTSWSDDAAGVYVYRVGKICILSYIGPLITGSGSGVSTQITVLPQGFRPPRDFNAACAIDDVIRVCTIGTNGTFGIWSFAGRGYPRTNIAYIVV